jgi:hypothetical protein
MILLQAQPYKHEYEYRHRVSHLWVVVAPLTDQQSYPHARSNYLAQGSSFGLLMVFFCCVLHKYDSLTSSDGLKDKMSSEQVGWMHTSVACAVH